MSVTSITRRRPHACIVAPEFIGPFPNGGVGTACYWEAVTLAQAGVDVTVLYTGPTDRETPEHWEQLYQSQGFTYVDLSKWAADGEAQAVDRMRHPCPEARTSELVYRYLRTRQVDLLLFQEFLGHGARTLQARQSGEALTQVPAAVTLHSCRQWIYQGMQRLNVSEQDVHVDFLERESARLADAVIAPSRHMADWAATHWPQVAPAMVVPYCYDRTVEPPATRVEHAGPFEHLVFFGRLETRKGLHLFCHALASSAEARGPVRRVTFLGKRSTVEGRPTDDFIRDTLGGIPDLGVSIVDTMNSFEALDWLGRQTRTLVVTPSLVDNLPYAVIELFTRRIPFVSTRIGGIPEIAGANNAHMMAEPTAGGLAAVLARVHAEGRLVTDYRDGYSSAGATDTHLAYLRSLMKWRPLAGEAPAETCDIVLVDIDARGLDEAKATILGADPTAQRGRFVTWSEWRTDQRATRPALFLSSSVTPRPGMVGRLLTAVADPRVPAATSYYTAEESAGPVDVAPLGASLEAGWVRNVFGGPCLVARPDACATIRETGGSTFQFWPAYVALASTGHEIALLPDTLYAVDGMPDDTTADAVDAVLRHYNRASTGTVDVGWVLKRARAAGKATPLYNQLLAIPSEQLAAYCGLTHDRSDRTAADLGRLRARLGHLVDRWQNTAPRVLVYGAGEHTQVVLALEPRLGQFITGFIDRRACGNFLGRPCISPDEVTPASADAILYSSREYERDMHARLSALPLEHVLLYSSSPAPSEQTIADRLRRRFGHETAPIDALRQLYRPPDWVTGHVDMGDAEFLLELVSGVRPQAMLELGVASGVSSAALLLALDHLPGNRRQLYSGDMSSTCYFAPNRPTGSAVQEMYPGHRTDWILDTCSDARRIATKLPAGSMDLLFIDANHYHPWPLLDLLHLAPVAAPGAWVALHDIELPTTKPEFQMHGAKWLFEAWPFNKVHGVGSSYNVGAVQLPQNLSALVPMALALLDRPWEHTPHVSAVGLPDMFADVTAAVQPYLRTVDTRKAV